MSSANQSRKRERLRTLTAEELPVTEFRTAAVENRAAVAGLRKLAALLDCLGAENRAAVAGLRKLAREPKLWSVRPELAR